jgi:hypothetical protein
VTIDRQSFIMRMTALCDVFRVEVSESLFEGYWIALHNLDVEDFNTAIVRALSESEFMPKPLELRKLAGLSTPDDLAIAAFQYARDAIGPVGCYRSPDFEDPAINAAIRNMGGWVEFCMQDAEKIEVWGRKEFERQYLAAIRLGMSGDRVAPLVGIAERHNVAMLGTCDPPVRVRCPLTAGEATRRMAIARGTGVPMALPEAVGE